MRDVFRKIKSSVSRNSRQLRCGYKSVVTPLFLLTKLDETPILYRT